MTSEHPRASSRPARGNPDVPLLTTRHHLLSPRPSLSSLAGPAISDRLCRAELTLPVRERASLSPGIPARTARSSSRVPATFFWRGPSCAIGLTVAGTLTRSLLRRRCPSKSSTSSQTNVFDNVSTQSQTNVLDYVSTSSRLRLDSSDRSRLDFVSTSSRHVRSISSRLRLDSIYRSRLRLVYDSSTTQTGYPRTGVSHVRG